MQELVALRLVKVPGWLDHALGLLPYVYLDGAVLFAVTGTTFIVCNYDPFVGFFRLSPSACMLVFGVDSVLWEQRNFLSCGEDALACRTSLRCHLDSATQAERQAD